MMSGMQILRFLGLAGLTACFIFGSMRSNADDAAGELICKLAQVDSLRGNFEQQQLGQNGEQLATSRGQFQLLRPGYFTWEISDPDSQLIVTDQQYLWHFDRDLHTVTRRPVNAQTLSSPLMVLGSDAGSLRQHYTVERVAENAYSLHALEGDPGFSELTVHFQGTVLSSLSLVNQLDQRLQITFSDVRTEPPLTPADFTFTPPLDADLFYYD